MEGDPQGPMPYAGLFNDPFQAKRFLNKEAELPKRQCRWCDSLLVRTAQGAIICGGFCDMPDIEDPEWGKEFFPPRQENE